VLRALCARGPRADPLAGVSRISKTMAPRITPRVVFSPTPHPHPPRHPARPSSSPRRSVASSARVTNLRPRFSRNSGERFRAALPTETRFGVARDVAGRDIKSKLKPETGSRNRGDLRGDIRADPGTVSQLLAPGEQWSFP